MLPFGINELPHFQGGRSDVVGRFTGRFLRRKRHGVARHHHQGVYATVTPAWSQRNARMSKHCPSRVVRRPCPFSHSSWLPGGTAAAATLWHCVSKSG